METNSGARARLLSAAPTKAFLAARSAQGLARRGFTGPITAADLLMACFRPVILSGPVFGPDPQGAFFRPPDPDRGLFRRTDPDAALLAPMILSGVY